jgi:hypothetical protein
MSFQRSICVSSLLFLLIGLSITSDAQTRRGNEGGWQLLGRSYVNSRGDHDTIVVNNRASFQALQLEVKGGSIEIQRVVVHFENGQDHQLDIRERIPANGRTREIDLPGDRRRIRSVEFWYSKESWRSRPYVNLWGRSGASVTQGPADEGRWEHLGRGYVNGRVDHDTILVNNRGTFRALQLGIKGGTIQFQRVVVHFENGEDHQLDIGDRIPDGGKTRVIDLPGNRRRIRSVEFWYSKEGWRSRPLVNVWGLR